MAPSISKRTTGSKVVKLTVKQQIALAHDLACEYETVISHNGGYIEARAWNKRTHAEMLAWKAVVRMAMKKLAVQ